MHRATQWQIFATLLCGATVVTADAAPQIVAANLVKPLVSIAAEKSVDTLSVDAIKNIRQQRVANKIALDDATTVTTADVGDPDSFGHNVTYLGSTQSSIVSLLPDCTPDPMMPPDPNDRCSVLPAQPAPVSFNEAALANMRLPAKATKSLLCFSLTPLVTFEFMNNTGVAQSSARFNTLVNVTIYNDLLNDPSLIDPTTGAAFNGQLTISLSTYNESRSLAVNERAEKSLRLSRSCIGGLLSKQALVQSYGLSDAQAKAFFKNSITLSFGASGSASMIDFATFFYGIRLYGD